MLLGLYSVKNEKHSCTQLPHVYRAHGFPWLLMKCNRYFTDTYIDDNINISYSAFKTFTFPSQILAVKNTSF